MIDLDNGRFTYTQNAADLLVLVKNPQNEVTTLIYDDANRIKEKTLGNGTVAKHSYADAGRLTRLANLDSTVTTLSSFLNTYDNADNRTQVVEANGEVVTWTYDVSYQLTRERRSGDNSFDTTFVYDPVGNRLKKIDSGTTTTLTYDAANELLTEITPSGRVTYTYDNAGNRAEKDTSSGTTFYSWDVWHRMTVAEPPAGAVTLTYNADHQRVEKETTAETKKFLYDFQKVLAETDGNDDTQNLYTSTTEEWGDLISQYDGTDSSYHQYTPQGSTNSLTDATETSTDEWIYRAFGQVESRTGTTDNDFTYIGKLGYFQDPEIDLYFVRRRYYDPAAARFLSEDTEGYKAGDVNLYRYVFNNPTNHVDPSGKAVWIKADHWDVVYPWLRHTFQTAYGRPTNPGQSDGSRMCVTGEGIERLTFTLSALVSNDPNIGTVQRSSLFRKVNLTRTLPWETWRDMFFTLYPDPG